MADFGAQDNTASRAEARAWLEAHFPPSLKARQDIAASEAPVPVEGDYALWKARMGETGWGVPTWPAAYGGGGLSAADARILREEMARIGGWNPIGGMGVMMFGPTLLEYGTEEQKPRNRSRRTSPPSSGANCAGARAIRSPARVRTWPPCRPGPRTRATTS